MKRRQSVPVGRFFGKMSGRLKMTFSLLKISYGFVWFFFGEVQPLKHVFNQILNWVIFGSLVEGSLIIFKGTYIFNEKYKVEFFLRCLDYVIL